MRRESPRHPHRGHYTEPMRSPRSAGLCDIGAAHLMLATHRCVFHVVIGVSVTVSRRPLAKHPAMSRLYRSRLASDPYSPRYILRPSSVTTANPLGLVEMIRRNA